MRVAHLTTVDSTLWFMLGPQLRAVVDDGGEAIGISAPGPWVGELERSGVRHIALPSSTRGFSPLGDLRAARELWRILRGERFDVLHTHNPKPGLYGRVIGRLAGVPIVVNTLHGLYATERDPWGKRMLVYALEWIAARFSDAELVQNVEDLELITRWRIVPARRARLLGNGIDLDRFDPGHVPDEARLAVRRVIGAQEHEIVVGIVGRLVAEKGYPELIAAAELLDPRFVVIAVGPEDPEKADRLPAGLQERARRSGMRFLGFRADIEAVYRAMDIFVLPTRREGFPRAAMEAAAMGLPVVASDVRGCRQVVEDGVTGMLVHPADPAALAAAIERLGGDERLRETMGAAGRRRALNDFDERRVVDIVIETYHELRARGTPSESDTP